MEKLGNLLKLDKGFSLFLYFKIYGVLFSDEFIIINLGMIFLFDNNYGNFMYLFYNYKCFCEKNISDIYLIFLI